MSVWGVRTDPAMVGQLDSKLMQEHTAATLTLVRAGIVRPDKGTKDMKALRARVESAYRAIGLPAPLTEAGAVSVSADSLEGLRLATVEAGLPVDTVLKTLEDTASNDAIRTHWLPALRVGAVWPVCCQYRSPMETGRTSSSAPNMQNPPKAGGVRECFIPRPGYVYAGADYDTLELRTLAQECLEMVGRSAMADALRAGRDLHLELAAELMGIPYAQAEALYNAGDATVIERRDLAKIANFGFPGGMVAKSFKAHCARFGVIIDLAEAERLHAAWKRAWPEMDVYFRLIKGMVGWDPEGGTIVQSMSRRVRGCVTYTAACNSRFQGRAADGAKEALWRLAVECYTGARTDGLPGLSPLFGCRPVVFMHDEIIIESPEDIASSAAQRLGEIMREGMSAWVPDVPIKAGPALFRRWHKGAKAVVVDGRMVPGKPEKYLDDQGKTKKRWVHDVGGDELCFRHG
jgi:hypothetical protein